MHDWSAPAASQLAARTLASGSMLREGLRNAAVERQINDPWFEYRRLIDREIEILRVHIGEARAHELTVQAKNVENELDR